ncbi:hypothetical protein L3V83_05030 [Thiotrichales bacterium 19X7-9]|nr:hypothetical protein [Thiotrichales bacterium 19X7-9]
MPRKIYDTKYKLEVKKELGKCAHVEAINGSRINFDLIGLLVNHQFKEAMDLVIETEKLAQANFSNEQMQGLLGQFIVFTSDAPDSKLKEIDNFYQWFIKDQGVCLDGDSIGTFIKFGTKSRRNFETVVDQYKQYASRDLLVEFEGVATNVIQDTQNINERYFLDILDKEIIGVPRSGMNTKRAESKPPTHFSNQDDIADSIGYGCCGFN